MFEFLKASVYALIIYPGIACILSLVLTRLCIGLLPRAGFVDMPDARRVHRNRRRAAAALRSSPRFF